MCNAKQMNSNQTDMYTIIQLSPKPAHVCSYSKKSMEELNTASPGGVLGSGGRWGGVVGVGGVG